MYACHGSATAAATTRPRAIARAEVGPASPACAATPGAAGERERRAERALVAGERTLGRRQDPHHPGRALELDLALPGQHAPAPALGHLAAHLRVDRLVAAVDRRAGGVDERQRGDADE